MNLKPRQAYEARARIAKALAHPSRLLILDALGQEEMCVCDLTKLVGADQSTVSKHLSVLKSGGLCVILDFFRPSTPAARLFYWTLGITIIPLVGGLVSGRPGAYWYLIRSIFQHMRLDEFLFLMETIGFRRVEGHNLASGIAAVAHGRVL